ncbi:uncharacterized protein LOC132918470 [Rhopalosiphum padi]|uniref:uncharacterized protein LOC132918470 n=1 Tax=Rhopalosiphum padi TaxID=40932 RepID=UPI00298EA694|nr:uncharacterized protein LOC132918470 [Rhopalosiphum padi]
MSDDANQNIHYIIVMNKDYCSRDYVKAKHYLSGYCYSLIITKKRINLDVKGLKYATPHEYCQKIHQKNKQLSNKNNQIGESSGSKNNNKKNDEEEWGDLY